MWAYKYTQKETKLYVPKFNSFFFQNQDILKLWYEDQSEPLEDRVGFAMRVFKYSVQIFIQLAILVWLIGSEDSEFFKVCDKRHECYNTCDATYFPSLICNNTKDYDLDIKIVLNNNTFDRFYKYPDPKTVKKAETM